ncbi:hypothetical protein [Paenibacillus mucilaginosus]|uniref:hypothetical protein n=1 Tax=Paenibacillus mucilaginosus TaxID=61624 RepID=UPI003D26370A
MRQATGQTSGRSAPAISDCHSTAAVSGPSIQLSGRCSHEKSSPPGAVTASVISKRVIMMKAAFLRNEPPAAEGCSRGPMYLF